MHSVLLTEQQCRVLRQHHSQVQHRDVGAPVPVDVLQTRVSLARRCSASDVARRNVYPGILYSSTRVLSTVLQYCTRLPDYVEFYRYGLSISILYRYRHPDIDTVIDIQHHPGTRVLEYYKKKLQYLVGSRDTR